MYALFHSSAMFMFYAIATSLGLGPFTPLRLKFGSYEPFLPSMAGIVDIKTGPEYPRIPSLTPVEMGNEAMRER